MYTNTVPQNLFDHWSAYWPSKFRGYDDLYFKSFTEQVGYPLVTIKLDNDGKSFTIEQKRFLLKKEDGSDASLLYTVPISYTTSEEQNFANTEPEFFLPSTPSTLRINLNKPISWIIANIQEAFYYRVNYDEKNWHAIHHSLNSNNWGGIHELNRAQIVDDLFNIARSGEISYDLALNVLEYLSTEIKYSPWTAAFTGFNYLTIRLGTNTEKFSHYIRQLTEKVYTNLGFDERDTDTTLEIYTRSSVLSWSCKYGNADCITKSLQHFRAMDQTTVPVNIREAVYCTAIREGNEADFNTLYQKYLTETAATETTLILNTLGCVRDTKLVERYFEIVISDAVRRQDKSAALTNLYTQNNENVMPVFRLVTQNHQRLANALGDYASVASVISSIASRFTEQNQLKELQDFNQQNKSLFGSSATTLENAEKTVSANLVWDSTRLASFTAYLENRTAGSTIPKGFTGLTLVIMALIARYLH